MRNFLDHDGLKGPEGVTAGAAARTGVTFGGGSEMRGVGATAGEGEGEGVGVGARERAFMAASTRGGAGSDVGGADVTDATAVGAGARAEVEVLRLGSCSTSSTIASPPAIH